MAGVKVLISNQDFNVGVLAGVGEVPVSETARNESSRWEEVRNMMIPDFHLVQKVDSAGDSVGNHRLLLLLAVLV